MYSTKDVMGILKISKPTLYKLCKQKKLKPNMIGNRYKFTEYDLKILAENTDIRGLEQKFSDLVKNVWFILNHYAKDLYGNSGEKKLKEIISKSNFFFMNSTKFKE